MNFITYDRNKYGHKLPTKFKKTKNGVLLNGKYPYHAKNAGYEEDILRNYDFEKESLLTTDNLGLFER
jgi:hypothetical protein